MAILEGLTSWLLVWLAQHKDDTRHIKNSSDYVTWGWLAQYLKVSHKSSILLWVCLVESRKYNICAKRERLWDLPGILTQLWTNSKMSLRPNHQMQHLWHHPKSPNSLQQSHSTPRTENTKIRWSKCLWTVFWARQLCSSYLDQLYNKNLDKRLNSFPKNLKIRSQQATILLSKLCLKS
jgi:hypothetical protein